jgi:uncharacterized pyridoxal phosphate-dependent enzyme
MLNELGVEKLVNGYGSVATIGGTIVSDDVIDAMKEVSKSFVVMEELHKAAGEHISSKIGAEAAYITSGAGAGIVLSVAACITRGNTEAMLHLPDTDHSASEVLIQKLHRSTFDYLATLAGGKLVEFGDEKATNSEDLRRAISKKTCAVLHFVFDPQEGSLPLEDVVSIAHEKGVPVIVDAAAELPPVSNLEKYAKSGADLAIFSAGKDMGAPNDTGLLVGRKGMIDICRRLGSHNYEIIDGKARIFIGRPMKVSKEDVVAVVAAFDKYLVTDHGLRIKKWEERVRRIVTSLSSRQDIRVRMVDATIEHGPRPLCIPRVQIDFLNRHVNAGKIMVELQSGHPPIYLYTVGRSLCINPQYLEDGDEDLISVRLNSILDSVVTSQAPSVPRLMSRSQPKRESIHP